MASDVNPPRVALVIIANAKYDHWDELKALGDAVNDLADALSPSFDLQLPALKSGGRKRDIEEALGPWLMTLGPKDRLFLYWSGHGTRDGNYYFVTSDSPKSGINALNAFSADVLGDIIAKCKAEKMVIFLDTCFSAAGAQTIANSINNIVADRTAFPGQVPYLAIVPSAHPLKKAREAVFCRALHSVLNSSDPTTGARQWSDGQPIIEVGDLLKAIRNAMLQNDPTWQPSTPLFRGWSDDFLPNPRYKPRPPIDVETGRRLAIPEALELAARGIEPGETGIFFTGRKAVIDDLTAWSRERRPGLRIITGPAGAGKSAVLGHMLTLSDPSFRAEALRAGLPFDPTAPQPGPVSAAIHVRGKTVDDFAISLGQQLGFSLLESGPAAVNRIVEECTSRPDPQLIVVDALDESTAPEAIGRTLNRLVADGGCRIILGSRRSPDGRVIPAAEPRHHRLRNLFGADADILDLDDDRNTNEDIRNYVTARLGQSKHGSDPEAIVAVAARVADASGGLFLYARVVARTLQEADRLDGPLPSGALDAFVADITARFGWKAGLVHALFAALPWGQGEGLSRRCWPAVANAVAHSGGTYTSADVDWVLNSAGWHIIEAQEANQAVYRLAHQAFADYYRGRIKEESQEIHERITEYLSENVSGLAWLNADPYVARHLSRHASGGACLSLIANDPIFLAVAEPRALNAAFESDQRSFLCRFKDTYQRAFASFEGAGITERMALIHLVARQNGQDEIEPPALPAQWECRWAYWRSAVPSTLVGKARPETTSASAVIIEARGTLLVCAAADQIYGWWLDEWAEMKDAATLDGEVTAMLTASLDGRPIVIAGTKAGTVTVLSLPGLEILARRKNAHGAEVNSLAMVPLPAGPLLATRGGDLLINLWSFPSLNFISKAKAHTLPDGKIALAQRNGEPILISSGDTYNARPPALPLTIWSVPGLDRIAEFGTPRAGIGHLHIVEVEGDLVLFGSRYGDLQVYDLRSLQPIPIHGSSSDDPVKANYFLPSNPSGNYFVNAYAQMRALNLTALGKSISINSTPWIETTGGVWTNFPAASHRSRLISVDADIRLWGEGTLARAIDAAPRTTEEMFALQQKFGFSAVAAAGNILWGVSGGADLTQYELLGGTKSVALPGSLFKTDRMSIGDLKIAVVKSGARNILVAGGRSGQVKFLDFESGNPVYPDLEIGYPVSALAVQSDDSGASIAVAVEGKKGMDKDFQIHVFGLNPGGKVTPKRKTPTRILGWTDKTLNAVALSGDLVIAAGNPPYVLVSELSTSEELRRIQIDRELGHVEDVAVCDASEGKYLVVGLTYGGFGIWDLNSGRQIAIRTKAHQSATKVTPIRWLGNPAIATGGGANHNEGFLRIWTLKGEPLHEIPIGAPIKQILQAANNDLAIATLRGLVVLKTT